MNTEALDLLIQSEIDRSNLQASDESFWSIEHLKQAAAEYAQLCLDRGELTFRRKQFLEMDDKLAQLRAELDEARNFIEEEAFVTLKARMWLEAHPK